MYVYVATRLRAVAYVRSPTSIMSARLRHKGGGSFDLDNESADVDVTTLEPRVIIRRGARWREKFCSYWTDNLPDLSDRPEIPAEKVQFWMKDEDKRGGRKRSTRRKRYPAAHSRLRGLRGQTLNEGIDYAIAANKWCVSFKDDDGTLVNLVDNCIVCVWLKYISKMVSLQCCVYDTASTKSCLRNVVFVNHFLSTSCRIRQSLLRVRLNNFTSTLFACTHTQRGRPMPESNACQLVLKYMLINQTIFVKSYHDRMYFYSSGTKFGLIVGPLQDWQRKHEKALKAFQGDKDDRPPNPTTLLKRVGKDYDGMHALLGEAILTFMKFKPQPYGT